MATYFMRDDGTAANKGAAGGPGSVQSACMNVAVHNGETFSAGDIIKLADDGGDFRARVIPPSSGASGNPIIYEEESGDTPILNGSDIITGWTEGATDVWEATLTTEAFDVFFDGTQGTKKGSLAAVTADQDWFWDTGSNLLHQFSTSDPDTRYTTPGTEATIRVDGIVIQPQEHITLRNFTVKKARSGVRVQNFTGTVSGITIDNITVLEIATTGAFNAFCIHVSVSGGATISGLTVKNCTLTPANLNRGVDSGESGIWISGVNGFIDNLSVLNNTVGPAGEDGMVLFDVVGGLIDGNTLGGNSENSIDSKGSQGVTFSNNTMDNDGQHNMVLHEAGGTLNSQNNIIEFNTFSRGGQNGGGTRSCLTMGFGGNNNICRYNKISDAFGQGVLVNNETDDQVYYNLIWNWGTGGVDGGVNVFNATGTKVYNNTCHGETGGDYAIHLESGGSGTEVKNNISHNPITSHIRVESGTETGFVSDNNLFFPDGAGMFNWLGTTSDFAGWKTNSSQDANSVNADPLLVDPANDDFHLQSTSPAIDAGANVSLTQDFDGNPVPV